MCILLHYYDVDHAHSNGQERVYPHTLSCLLNGGRHLNLVWGYTWTLPLLFRQERECRGTLFPAQIKYSGATKSVGVHSFLPTIFRQQRVQRYTLSCLLYIGNKECRKECTPTLFPAWKTEARSKCTPTLNSDYACLCFSGRKECRGSYTLSCQLEWAWLSK